MNDETLVLYYYNDGLSQRQRREVEAALAADPELADRYALLCGDLDFIAEVEADPAPPHVVQRLHDSLDRIAQPTIASSQARSRSFNLTSFAWGAAVTAVLAIGIGIGVYFSAPDALPGSMSRDPFARGMLVHLQDTQREISAMPVDSAADRSDLIMHIVDQNRLFERAAEQNDARDLARVLRAFEPILLRLAAENIAPEDARALRAQLAFELNVMLTKLSRDTSKETHST